jgi:SAM-dependent methyltransferase
VTETRRTARWSQPGLDARFYPNYVDEQERYMARVAERVGAQTVVLDAGCGHQGLDPEVAARAAWVLGVDLDESIRENATVSARLQADLARLPLQAESVDLVASRYVVEHLADPLAVFREFARVLRPGGHVVLLTPNAWHYVSLVSRLVPHRLHQWVNERRGRQAEDTFPTRYRANTARKLRRLAERAGLAMAACERFESKPNYLAFSRVAYLLGIAYERAVNAASALAFLRVNLLAVLTRPPRAEAAATPVSRCITNDTKGRMPRMMSQSRRPGSDRRGVVFGGSIRSIRRFIPFTTERKNRTGAR